MPRTRVAPRYVERIETLAAEGFTAAKITQMVKAWADEHDWADWPHGSTVEKYYKLFRAKPAEYRRQAAFFCWPDSMENGALPWEAARAGLDLLRFRDEHRLRPPTAREVKWYWRVTLASPTIDRGNANRLASLLAEQEFCRDIGAPAGFNLGAFPWVFAYEPWRGPEHKAAYQAAIAAPESGAHGQGWISGGPQDDGELTRWLSGMMTPEAVAAGLAKVNRQAAGEGEGENG